MRDVVNDRRRWAVGCLLLLLLIVPTSRAATDFSGYWKTYLQAINYPSVEMLGVSVGLSKEYIFTNRLRLKLEATLPENLELAVAYDLAPRAYIDGNKSSNLFSPGFGLLSQIYRVDDLNPEIWEEESGDYGILHNLDRLQLTLRLPRADLIVGRQAISWGSARAINPTDILAPFAYGEIDVEDRLGVDAVRLRAPLGLMGELDGGMAFGPDLAADNSAWFLRARYFILHTDFFGIISGFRGNTLLGFDLTRALSGFGSWLEAGYVVVEDDTTVGEHNYWRVSLGADYSLRDGTYLFAEYHYSEAGVTDPADYPPLAGLTPYREGGVYLLGRHYLIPGVTRPITPLLTATVQVITNINLENPSAYLTVTMEYSICDNSYLSWGVYKGAGKGPYPDDDNMFAAPLIGSEFGSYAGRFYFSYRTYF